LWGRARRPRREEPPMTDQPVYDIEATRLIEALVAGR
jgi:hypothetical protein